MTAGSVDETEETRSVRERTAQHRKKAEKELWRVQRQTLPSQIFSGSQSSISRHYHEIAADESKRLRGLCDSSVRRNLSEAWDILFIHILE